MTRTVIYDADPLDVPAEVGTYRALQAWAADATGVPAEAQRYYSPDNVLLPYLYPSLPLEAWCNEPGALHLRSCDVEESRNQLLALTTSLLAVSAELSEPRARLTRLAGALEYWAPEVLLDRAVTSLCLAMNDLLQTGKPEATAAALAAGVALALRPL